MASLNDAHIVAVYDVEQSEEMAFIAMELVEGLSLEQTLRLAGPLSVKETVRIGVAVARALAAGHRNGVLHRDLKSANVLLGEDRTVKVADFGVLNAVLLDGEESLLSGTPGFIAPESIEDGVYDEQSDLFGLGCVLYHCLVGEGPFAASTVAATLELTCQSVDLGTLQDLAPAPLALLIRELLSRDRAQRPSSARSVIERLEPLLAEE